MRFVLRQSMMTTAIRILPASRSWWMEGPRASRGMRESSSQGSRPALTARSGCSLRRPSFPSALWLKHPGTLPDCPALQGTTVVMVSSPYHISLPPHYVRGTAVQGASGCYFSSVTTACCLSEGCTSSLATILAAICPF